MLEVQRAAERYRGGDPTAGVETRHAFSFAGFYDPDNVRFGPLTACNEELLAPGAGFGSHPHRDLEIVTWVVEGELTHEDSDGHRAVIRPGDVQRLTAGSGVRHAERNDGQVPLRFVQMWLVPDEPGGAAEYEVVRQIADGAAYPLPRTGARLRVRRLPQGGLAALPDRTRSYLHVVRGSVALGGETLGPGDAARIAAGQGLVAEAGEPAELLLWELSPPSGR